MQFLFRSLGPTAASMVLIACLWCGCAMVGPDYHRPSVLLNENWLESKDAGLKAESEDHQTWWKTFNDPTLDWVVETAYRENLNLRIAGVRVLEARAQLGIVTGQLYPQTQQVTGSLQNVRESAGVPLSGTSSNNTRFDGTTYNESRIGVTATWEIDFWGKFRRAIEAADADLLAAVADYDSTLVSLTANAAVYYITIRTIERRLIIARRNLEIQRESLKIAEARFHGGATSQRDVEQARTLLLSTEALIPPLRIELRRTKDALSVLLGMPPNILAGRLQSGIAQIPSPPAEVAAGIPLDLLRRRPDIRSAEYNAMAQSARIGVAKSQMYPAFSLSGDFGFLSSDAGRNGLGDLFHWRNRMWSIGPGVQWNIFNYGRIANDVRLQDARFQELLLTYRNVVLGAQQDVEDNLAGFLWTQEQAVALRQSAEAAYSSLSLALIQYREGATDFTTVLTAQQSLLNEEDSLAGATGNISSFLVGVYRALGGGWQIREGHEFVPGETRRTMETRTDWGNLLVPENQTPSERGPDEDLIRSPDW